MFVYLLILLQVIVLICLYIYHINTDLDSFVFLITNILNPIYKYFSLIGDKIYYNNNTLEESKILQNSLTTSKFCVVTFLAPICPAIFFPLKTLPGS